MEKLPLLKTEQQEKLPITDSKSFQEAITQGNLKGAKEWLIRIREEWDEYMLSPVGKEKPKRNDKVISDRERELIRAYREKGMAEKKKGNQGGAMAYFKQAKELIEKSIHPDNLGDRKKKLAEDSGMDYDEIKYN
jgi:hypothetical protein